MTRLSGLHILHFLLVCFTFSLDSVEHLYSVGVLHQSHTLAIGTNPYSLPVDLHDLLQFIICIH